LLRINDVCFFAVYVIPTASGLYLSVCVGAVVPSNVVRISYSILFCFNEATILVKSTPGIINLGPLGVLLECVHPWQRYWSHSPPRGMRLPITECANARVPRKPTMSRQIQCVHKNPRSADRTPQTYCCYFSYHHPFRQIHQV